MMMKGSSRPWPETLKEMTGSDQLDPQAMIDYFQPLYVWLSNQNLTDVDWDCDSYLTRDGRVKSYAHRSRELASTSSSLYIIDWLNNLKIIFAFVFYLIF